MSARKGRIDRVSVGYFIDRELLNKVNEYVELIGCSKSFFAEEALKAYLASGEARKATALAQAQELLRGAGLHDQADKLTMAKE